MKILMLFVDMLRPNLLNSIDSSEEITLVDKRIAKWGGTLYTRCYTPAPDTPRSAACLWSSRYPKDNGCDNRLKYPGFFLKEDNQDLLSQLSDAGYKFNFYMHPSTEALGQLPASVKNIGNYSNGKLLEEYLQCIHVEADSVTYICLDDFHHVVSDVYGQKNTCI